MKRNLYLILLCILCLGFIFFNSSQVGKLSQQRSNNIVNEIVIVVEKSDIGNKIKEKYTRQDLNVIVRKFAHGFEYSILSVIFYLTYTSFNVKGKDVIIYTLFTVLLCAVFDELFQLYVSDRTSSVLDVLIDFSGGIIGVTIIRSVIKKKIST